MKAIQAALGLLAGFFLLANPSLAGEAGDHLTVQLEETVASFRDQYDFPGATAAIVLPDGTVRTAATGLADVEAGREMTPATRMLAASVGKTFVGAIILALEFEGLLSQSDLLADHLGDRSWFPNLPNSQAITLGHLLRHQSGLPDHVHLLAFQTALRERIAKGEPTFKPEELIQFLDGHEPLFLSGGGWAYSDTGYILLALVIEQTTGQTYYNLVQNRLLDPLGLTDTIPSDRPNLSRLAVGYTSADNPFGLPERTADASGRLAWDPAVEWAGGGFASTSHDLARWGHILFNGKALNSPYLERLLDSAPVAPDSPGIRYGAGSAVYEQSPRGPVYGHGGWIPGYVSSLRHYPDHGVTIAFQINSDAGLVNEGLNIPAELEAALADMAIGAVQSAEFNAVPKEPKEHH
jgi:D-alanyl-D-alanine carboxypeptidase